MEALIRTNPVAVIKRLRQEQEEASSESARQALAALLRYLTANLDGLWYGERLHRGEPIGPPEAEWRGPARPSSVGASRPTAPAGVPGTPTLWGRWPACSTMTAGKPSGMPKRPESHKLGLHPSQGRHAGRILPPPEARKRSGGARATSLLY